MLNQLTEKLKKHGKFSRGFNRIPPMFSAVKLTRRLYDYARAGDLWNAHNANYSTQFDLQGEEPMQKRVAKHSALLQAVQRLIFGL